MSKLHIGEEVVNFGVHAIVWNFHPTTGDPILRDVDGNKWVADPEKCVRCGGTISHPDGLVQFII